MEYLRKEILNKRKLALLIGMPPTLFDAKLNHRNYNKFNPDQIFLINKKIKEQFQDMPDVLRILLVEFCEELSIPALNLLEAGEFEYVVDSYMNKLV